MQRLSDGDQVHAPSLQPTLIGTALAVVNRGVCGRLGQHRAADVGGDYPPKVSGKRDTGLATSRGAVPHQIMSGGCASQEGEQLIGVSRPPQRIGICNHREVVGGFHGAAEAPVSAP